MQPSRSPPTPPRTASHRSPLHTSRSLTSLASPTSQGLLYSLQPSTPGSAPAMMSSSHGSTERHHRHRHRHGHRVRAHRNGDEAVEGEGVNEAVRSPATLGGQEERAPHDPSRSWTGSSGDVDAHRTSQNSTRSGTPTELAHTSSSSASPSSSRSTSWHTAVSSSGALSPVETTGAAASASASAAVGSSPLGALLPISSPSTHIVPPPPPPHITVLGHSHSAHETAGSGMERITDSHHTAVTTRPIEGQPGVAIDRAMPTRRLRRASSPLRQQQQQQPPQPSSAPRSSLPVSAPAATSQSRLYSSSSSSVHSNENEVSQSSPNAATATTGGVSRDPAVQRATREADAYLSWTLQGRAGGVSSPSSSSSPYTVQRTQQPRHAGSADDIFAFRMAAAAAAAAAYEESRATGSQGSGGIPRTRSASHISQHVVPSLPRDLPWVTSGVVAAAGTDGGPSQPAASLAGSGRAPNETGTFPPSHVVSHYPCAAMPSSTGAVGTSSPTTSAAAPVHVAVTSPSPSTVPSLPMQVTSHESRRAHAHGHHRAHASSSSPPSSSPAPRQGEHHRQRRQPPPPPTTEATQQRREERTAHGSPPAAGPTASSSSSHPGSAPHRSGQPVMAAPAPPAQTCARPPLPTIPLHFASCSQEEPVCRSQTASATDWIRLNVGGRLYVTTLATLMADPHSLLAHLAMSVARTAMTANSLSRSSPTMPHRHTGHSRAAGGVVGRHATAHHREGRQTYREAHSTTGAAGGAAGRRAAAASSTAVTRADTLRDDLDGEVNGEEEEENGRRSLGTAAPTTTSTTSTAAAAAAAADGATREWSQREDGNGAGYTNVEMEEAEDETRRVQRNARRSPSTCSRSTATSEAVDDDEGVGAGGEYRTPTTRTVPDLDAVQVDVDQANYILLDLDPDYFTPVLNYLRHGVVAIPPLVDPRGVLAVAQFLNVAGVVRQLRPPRPQRRQLLFSWGCGTNGELGTHRFVDCPVPTPVQVTPFGVSVRHIALGSNYSCVHGSDGNLYTFGNGDWGQLGLGKPRDLDTHPSDKSAVALLPTRVPLFERHRAVHVSAGYAFAMAITMDFDTRHGAGAGAGAGVGEAAGWSSHVYFWGNNNHGQSGLGPQYFDYALKKIDEPTLVGTLEGKRIVQLGCGSFFSLALSADGVVYSWGLVECLGLGTPDEVRRKYEGTGVLGSSLSNEKRSVVLTPQPVRFRGLTGASPAPRITRVHAGQWHGAAISASGELFTWGVGYQGRLGHGNKEPAYVPTRVRGALEGHVVVDVACGSFHTVALTNRGSVFCWGDNASGQCGTSASSTEALTSPCRVVGLEYVAGGVAKGIACGRQHTVVVMSGPQPGCPCPCCQLNRRGQPCGDHAQVYAFGENIRGIPVSQLTAYVGPTAMASSGSVGAGGGNASLGHGNTTLGVSSLSSGNSNHHNGSGVGTAAGGMSNAALGGVGMSSAAAMRSPGGMMQGGSQIAFPYAPMSVASGGNGGGGGLVVGVGHSLANAVSGGAQLFTRAFSGRLPSSASPLTVGGGGGGSGRLPATDAVTGYTWTSPYSSPTAPTNVFAMAASGFGQGPHGATSPMRSHDLFSGLPPAASTTAAAGGTSTPAPTGATAGGGGPTSSSAAARGGTAQYHLIPGLEAFNVRAVVSGLHHAFVFAEELALPSSNSTVGSEGMATVGGGVGGYGFYDDADGYDSWDEAGPGDEGLFLYNDPLSHGAGTWGALGMTRNCGSGDATVEGDAQGWGFGVGLGAGPSSAGSAVMAGTSASAAAQAPPSGVQHWRAMSPS